MKKADPSFIFFQKPLKVAQNGNFFKKYQLLALFGVLKVKMQFLAVLRHLEGFLEKSEESRKLKNNGGLLSAIFL